MLTMNVSPNLRRGFEPGAQVLVAWAASIRQRGRFFTRVLEKRGARIAIHLPPDDPWAERLMIGSTVTLTSVGVDAPAPLQMVVRALSTLTPAMIVLEPLAYAFTDAAA